MLGDPLKQEGPLQVDLGDPPDFGGVPLKLWPPLDFQQLHLEDEHGPPCPKGGSAPQTPPCVPKLLIFTPKPHPGPS